MPTKMQIKYVGSRALHESRYLTGNLQVSVAATPTISQLVVVVESRLRLYESKSVNDYG